MKTISKIFDFIIVAATWILLLALCCFYKHFSEKELIVYAMMAVLGFIHMIHKEKEEEQNDR